MRSIVTRSGQTVIPAAIRRQFHIGPADRIEWVVDGNDIRIVPVKQDPITAFRGQGKGGSTARLIEDRLG